MVPGVAFSPHGRPPGLWYNPAACGPPTPGFRGTSGRNILTGPDYKTLDFALVKDFPFSEKRKLQFRAEVFNLLNRANFDLPANADDGEQVFAFSAPSAFTRINTAGKIFSTNGDSREIQFGLKLIF